MIPIDFSFIFAVEELYGTQYQSGSFSLFIVESGLHCLHCVIIAFLLPRVAYSVVKKVSVYNEL